MNKNKQHSQDVFHDMCKCVLFFGCTNYNDIAEALLHVGVRNTVGDPYTPKNLRKMVERWNRLPEDDDFRQDHIERYLPQSKIRMRVDDEVVESGSDEPLVKSGDVEKYHTFFNPTVASVH